MMDLSNEGQKPIGLGPKTRVCYICGRQYSLHSFEIHIKQCKELWIAREAQKDPRERKKLPEDPLERLQGSGGSSLASPGGVMESTGGGDGPAALSRKELDELNKLSSDAYNTETLDTCKFCGRSFLPEKLVIHNRSCTADNPARKVTDKVRRGNDLPPVSGLTDKPQENLTPVRPKTTSSSMHNPRKMSSPLPEIDSKKGDDAVNLKLENGALVGHLGGPSGRPLRKSPDVKKPPVAVSADIDRIETKEELVAYFSDRIELMESNAHDLLKSAAELRQLLAKFSELK